MTILTVLEYPDPRLKIKAKPVSTVDAETQQQLKDMIETMYHDHGGGLAATQVAIEKRMFVMDASSAHNNPQCFINPEIIERDGEIIEEEGCLSFPGVVATVKRARHIKVRALDFDGKPFEAVYDGDYSARCVQHEIDHLDGIVYFDRLSPLKRKMVEKKFKKYKAELM
jgi:peptide deformylase